MKAVQCPLEAGRVQYDFGTMNDFARSQLSDSLESRLSSSFVVKTPGGNHKMTYEATALFLACLHHQQSTPFLMSLHLLIR